MITKEIKNNKSNLQYNAEKDEPSLCHRKKILIAKLNEKIIINYFKKSTMGNSSILDKKIPHA